MFLRKLTVILLPLAALSALLGLRSGLIAWGVWGEILAGLLCGACLALLPRVAGARGGRVPFRRQLLVPAGLLLVLLFTQALAVHGVHTLLPASLAAPDAAMLTGEAVLAGAALVTGLAG